MGEAGPERVARDQGNQPREPQVHPPTAAPSRKSTLRGMSFAEGEKALAPIQLKPERSSRIVPSPTPDACHADGPESGGLLPDSRPSQQDDSNKPIAVERQPEACGAPAQDDEPCEALEAQELEAVMAARAKASSALTALSNATVQALDGCRAAQEDGWFAFLKVCGASPELALEDQEYLDILRGRSGVQGQRAPALVQSPVVRTSVVSGANRGVKIGLEALGRRAGLGAARTLLKVLTSGLGGFVVGVAGSLAFNAIIALLGPDPKELAEVAGAAKAMTAAQAAQARIRGIDARSKADWASHHTALTTEINQAFDVDALGALTYWLGQLQAQLPRPIDSQQLKMDLMERWTLQHSGSTSSAGGGTNTEAWENAAQELDEERTAGDQPQGSRRTNSAWQRRDGEIQKRDLWTDQVRLHLNLAGLDPEPLIKAGRERNRGTEPEYTYARVASQTRLVAMFRQHHLQQYVRGDSVGIGNRAVDLQLIVRVTLCGWHTSGTTADRLNYQLTNTAGQQLHDWSQPIE